MREVKAPPAHSKYQVSLRLEAAKDKVSVLHSMAKKFMGLLSLKRLRIWANANGDWCYVQTHFAIVDSE
jgi:hypothetical protein